MRTPCGSRIRRISRNAAGPSGMCSMTSEQRTRSNWASVKCECVMSSQTRSAPHAEAAGARRSRYAPLDVRRDDLLGDRGESREVDAGAGTDLERATRSTPPAFDRTDDPVAAASVQPATGRVARVVERLLQLEQRVVVVDHGRGSSPAGAATVTRATQSTEVPMGKETNRVTKPSRRVSTKLVQEMAREETSRPASPRIRPAPVAGATRAAPTTRRRATSTRPRDRCVRAHDAASAGCSAERARGSRPPRSTTTGAQGRSR